MKLFNNKFYKFYDKAHVLYNPIRMVSDKVYDNEKELIKGISLYLYFIGVKTIDELKKDE